jgi:hypothetical protein
MYGAAVTINQSDKQFGCGAQTSAPFDPFILTYSDFIVQPSAFWTRKLWHSTGDINIDYNYVLDWEWFIRASKITKFQYVPRFYSVYRYHPLHKTSNGGIKRQKEIIDVVKKYSSTYWIDLYLQIEQQYESIQKRLTLLADLKIPKKHIVLPLFFPKLMTILKRQQDLYTVLAML